MSFLFGGFDVARIVLVLLGTIAFVVSGMLFFIASIRAGQEARTRRVELAMPRVPPALGKAKSAARDLDARLLKLPGQGLPDREQRAIVRYLSKLGIPRAWAISSFAVGRLLAAILLGVAAMVILPSVPVLTGSIFVVPLACICAVAGGWWLPPMLIRRSAQQRASAAVGALPEAIDLLVVCVDAGLSLEDSLRRVVTELGQSHPELAEELSLTSADLQILPSRDEALANMAERVDLPGMRAFVSTLTQTLRYGTPLAQALRTIASELRNDTLIKLEERANQLPALLTVPLMLFIMPTIFLIIGGPAVLRLIDAFGG